MSTVSEHYGYLKQALYAQDGPMVTVPRLSLEFILDALIHAEVEAVRTVAITATGFHDPQPD